jgi:PAS domain S-box-containing protein
VPAALRILIVENVPADAALVETELRRAGFVFEARRVETRADYLAALRDSTPDLILSECRLPRFDGMEALTLAQSHAPHVPLIVVTGAIDGQTALECTQAGAADHVPKDHLSRLGPAVRRVLERQSALRESAASERKYRALFDEAPDAIVMADPVSGMILDANARAVELTGRSLGELRALLQAEIHPRSDRERAAAALAAALDGLPRIPLNLHVRHADGRSIPVELAVRVFLDTDGERRVATTLRDVTLRRRADTERALLSTAIEQTADATIITDATGTIEYVNPAFERLTGYSRDEAIGQNPRLLKSGVQGPEDYRQLWLKLAAGEVFTGTFVNRRKDGVQYIAEISISPVRDPSGRIIRYVGLQRDVTRERDLEDQLRQMQKLESLGQLTGGIAHDFKNQLGVILANIALIRAELPEDRGDLRSYLADLEQAAENGVAMARKLLAFSRKERISLQPVDLGLTLREHERALRRLLPETISVRRDAADDGPTVLADPGALEQVLLNLAMNARDAMPQGGTLTISARPVDVRREDDPHLQGFDRRGRFACIAVTDTGQGMDSGTLGRAFEPFFTTKPVGAGTGLGLAMVFGLMKQHGGFVRLYSERGHGTTARLFFPITDAVAVAAPERAAAPHGTETLLLVEDQEMLRRATARTLGKLGYTVVAASDGAEGLRLLREQAGTFALVISDVVMPNVGGVELYQRARAEGIRVRFLLTSGYIGGPSDAAVPPGVPLLEKPWSVEAFAQKVREVLEGELPE